MTNDQVEGNSKRVGLGVIGLGGFARFALQHFLQAGPVHLVAVGGATSDEAKHCAARYGAPVLDSAAAVCERSDVDWVYINTPPFLHAEQAAMAIRAGKNVLVEKPMATTAEDAERLQQLAQQNGVRVVTNLMQRYNPVVTQIKTILDEGLLGRPQFFNFNNHAVDEGLPDQHWFWDREKSGGIFVEHGVHFFDLANYWFGDGVVTGAGRATRAVEAGGSPIEDQVWCDTRHRRGEASTVCRFYHGFNQSSRTEDQRWEIVCERGHITTSGWIPMGFDLVGIVDEAQSRRMDEVTGGARTRIIEQYSDNQRSVRGGGRVHQVYQKISVSVPPPVEKSELYGDLLVDLFRDQVIGGEGSPLHDARGGLNSLRLAVEAARRSLQ